MKDLPDCTEQEVAADDATIDGKAGMNISMFVNCAARPI